MDVNLGIRAGVCTLVVAAALALPPRSAWSDEVDDLIAVLEKAERTTRHQSHSFNASSFNLAGKTPLEVWLRRGGILPAVPNSANCMGVIVGGAITAGILDKGWARELLKQSAPAAAMYVIAHH